MSADGVSIRISPSGWTVFFLTPFSFSRNKNAIWTSVSRASPRARVIFCSPTIHLRNFTGGKQDSKSGRAALSLPGCNTHPVNMFDILSSPDTIDFIVKCIKERENPFCTKNTGRFYRCLLLNGGHYTRFPCDRQAMSVHSGMEHQGRSPFVHRFRLP